jgi:hypothetical protein
MFVCVYAALQLWGISRFVIQNAVEDDEDKAAFMACMEAMFAEVL